MENNKQDLIEMMHKFAMQFHRYQAYATRGFGPRPSPWRGQGRVLTVLKMQPQISQKDLAILLDMRQQSLSELLSKLERSGYITRTPSPEDGRVTLVTLTETGKAAAGELKEKELAPGRVFDCLTPEEQQRLKDYLSRLSGALEAEMKDAGPDMDAFGGMWGPMCRRPGPPHAPEGRHPRDGRFGPGRHGWGFGAHPQSNEEAEETED